MGGNLSKVEHWLVKRARNAENFQEVLDVSCGIGIPGHTLRLCGLNDARMTGTDISAGMLREAERRQCYDRTFVADANAGFGQLASDSFDLLVCTGAMELLDHSTVLAEFYRLLKPGGKAWLSFQWEGVPSGASPNTTGRSLPCPTAHQNVRGVTLEEMSSELSAANLEVLSVDCCKDAFYTPSPAQDGSLIPVPYLFVEAAKPLHPEVLSADVSAGQDEGGTTIAPNVVATTNEVVDQGPAGVPAAA